MLRDRSHRLLAVLVTLVGLVAGLTQAQTNYTATLDSGTFVGLGGSATVIWDGSVAILDDAHQDIPIGFIFTYYGVNYSSLRVSTNGYATFPPSSGVDWSNDTIPDGDSPNPVLAPWWDDLAIGDFGATDFVLWEQEGVLPGTRSLTVEWRSVSGFGDSPADYKFVYFQLRLIENGDVIEFHYGTSGTFGSPFSTFSATIGIENQTGSLGVAPYGPTKTLSRSEFPDPNTILRFTPASPDAYSYSYCDGLYASLPWGSVATALWDGSTGTADDDFLDLPIGFPFEYFGTTYHALRVSTNGYVTFLPGAGTAHSNDPIPSTSSPDPVLAPWWDDLQVSAFGITDVVRYETDGLVPGSRRCSVEWSSVSRYGDSATNYNYATFQLHLFEDGHIEFHYGPIGTVGSPFDYSASLGLEDPTGLIGVTPLVGSPDLERADFPAPYTLICFEPPMLACGDCNGDTIVSILDALAAAQHAVGVTSIVGSRYTACNVAGTPGGDGTPGTTVDVLDALNVARRSAGTLGSLSCGG
jgi:hypothetical protein